MEKQKDSFIFYRSFYEAIKELPKENQLNIYNAIMELSLNKKEIELSGIDKTIFTLIKPNIFNALKNYENGCFGGRPNKPKNNPIKTQSKPKNNPIETNEDEDVDVDKDKDNKYYFNGYVIKLNKKDFDDWRNIYPNLDLDSELQKRDIWLNNCENPPKNWFISTMQYFVDLNKKNKPVKKDIKLWID